MNLRFCPECVSRGVDSPLMVSGECTYCGHRYAPITHRIADYEYRLRFAVDSLRFRLGATTGGARSRAAIGGLIARLH
ncbi:hypothetical protein [Halalkalicoccus subterraneus]|uniref:hypothetical protein n=1 Tax=Halalkalicoccus subterraneus TaxID=2675002 RepID=UPI000EFD8001|nr:hypothetical protein [Halalkalicoccus subterraneus]